MSVLVDSVSSRRLGPGWHVYRLSNLLLTSKDVNDRCAQSRWSSWSRWADKWRWCAISWIGGFVMVTTVLLEGSVFQSWMYRRGSSDSFYLKISFLLPSFQRIACFFCSKWREEGSIFHKDLPRYTVIPIFSTSIPSNSIFFQQYIPFNIIFLSINFVKNFWQRGCIGAFYFNLSR